MKEEAGAVFIITLPSVLRPMGSWWPNGTVFPPPLVPVDWDYPSPKCRPSSALGDRRVRLERHSPRSIATLRQTISRILLRQLSSCPFVELHIYNTVVLDSGIDKLPESLVRKKGIKASTRRAGGVEVPQPAATGKKLGYVRSKLCSQVDRMG
jgi:hypothetical protein